MFLSVQLLGSSAERPLLSEAARASGADLHFLHAEIGRLHQSSYGRILVEVSGEAAAITSAIRTLEDGGAIVTPIDLWNASPSAEAVA